MLASFLPTLSRAINAYLDLDAESRTRLQSLQGKTITIELLPFHFLFHCTFAEGKLILLDDSDQPANTTLRGTPLQMLNVMLLRTERHRFFADDLVIEGDAALGQHIVELFDAVHIDWEEHASRVIGDIPVHHASRFVKKLQSWVKTTGSHVSGDVNAYVHEEKQWLPSREALHDFFSDIDTLALDVERAQARLQNLATLIHSLEEQP